MSSEQRPSTSASPNEGGNSTDLSSSSAANSGQEVNENSDCCGFTTRKFTSVAYVAFLFTIAVIFLVASNVQTDKKGIKFKDQLSVYGYLTLVLFISIIWMASTIASRWYLNWARRRMPSHIEPKKDLIPTRLLVGVMFFGLGSSFMTMVDFIQYLARRECYVSENLTMLFYYAVRTVFIYTQLYFFYKLSRYSERVMFFGHFLLMHLIAVNLGTWVVTFVHDSAEELNGESEEDKHLENSTIHNSAILFMAHHWGTLIKANETNETSCYKMVEKLRYTSHSMEPYLYTFTMEYCLISAGLLLNAWLSLQNKAVTTDQQRHENGINGVKKSLSSAKYRGKQFDGKIQYHKHCPSTSEDSDAHVEDSYVHVRASESIPEVGTLWRFGFIFGLVYIPAFFAIVFNMMYSDDNKQDQIIYVVMQFVFFVSIFIASGIGIRKLKNLGGGKTHGEVDYILLGVSLVGVVFLDLLIIVASICEWTTSPEIATCLLVANTMELACSIAFTYFVRKAFEIPNEKNNNVFYSSASTIREVVSFLFMLNLCFWALYTFEVKKSNKVLGIVETFYTDKVWFYLSHLAYPLAVFFHFHGAVCMVEILNLYSISKFQDITSISVSMTT